MENSLCSRCQTIPPFKALSQIYIVERFADPVLRDTLILICVVSKFTINVKIVEYIKD